ncbi:uncharacterized protein TNCV_2843861 [Trichonephila clavipes]|nr:uncharacterized protein TNCV_2843861 [Trichonephila clavipes]
MNCREHAYDNAATTAGCHTGVQQRIKDINPIAELVPCSNHSLNLVCVHAASVELRVLMAALWDKKLAFRTREKRKFWVFMDGPQRREKKTSSEAVLQLNSA